MPCKKSIVMILIAICLLPLSLYASAPDADNPPDLFCQPGKNAGGNPAFVGKPVSLLSGMETYAPSVDLTLGSLFPIRITRSYNSRTTYDSPVGYGWAFNYDKRLYIYADGSVTVRRGCGGKRRFAVSGTDYINQSGDGGTLFRNADGTFTYTDRNGETEKYDAHGRLLTMADAKGNSLAFYYELDSRSPLWGLLPSNVNQTTAIIVAYDYRLSRIEEKGASGALTNNYVLFHYNSFTGRLTDIMDGTGRTINYYHDGIGNLISVSGLVTNSTYGYSDPNNRHVLTSTTEGNGAYVNTYDPSGRVTRQVHGTGVIDIEYIIPYRQTRVTTTAKDSSGNVLNTNIRMVEFDANGMVIRATDTNGNITSYVRDSSTTWVLAEVHTDIISGVTTTTTHEYDTKGNVLTKIEALGTAIEKTTTYTYHPVFNGVLTETVQSVVDPQQDRTITNTYDDANGNLLTTTETGLLGGGTPYSYATAYTYDSNGKLHSIDGPRTDVSDVATYNYDPSTGYLTSMTQPLIGTTTYSNYNGLGNPQTVTDPNGNSTAYAYDAIGRVATVKAPGDTNATQYFYVSGSCGPSCNGTGKIDHIILPEGNTISFAYDSMGNLAIISDSLGNSINYTYDSEGNKLTEQITDSSGSLQKSLSYTYDALNRLSKVINPDSSFTQYGYGSFGNRTSIRTPNGPVTTSVYDALNRLTSVAQPGGVTTGFSYNTNNNLISVTDDNSNTTTYKYDDKGRVCQVISPDTGTTTYAYDPAGNLTAKTDAKGTTISYTYDALNRLTAITSPAISGLTAFSVTYAYDTCVNGKGRLCSMSDNSGSSTYEYTPKGQVKKETKTIDSIQFVTQYTYDQNGNVKTITYPSGKVITYSYTNDRVVSVLNGVTSLATNIIYKPFGGMASLTYGNGLTGSIAFDNQYRISGITAGPVMSLSYPTYDYNGNIMAINNGLDATKNKSFTYDALDRLQTATASGIWGSFTWTYDGVGNRLTENSSTYGYYPNTNKLTNAAGISYNYDNNGNTTTQNSRLYTYNQNQRLIQVADGAMTANYAYNGNGQRVMKNVNGTITIFLYSQNGQIIAESNSAGTITTEYVYLNGQPLAIMEGANAYYYHNDHLGTPQKMTDASETVIWAADYRPFGEATITVSTITNNLRFPGQYYDAETGNHYNYYRDYNPVIGKYSQSDQLGLAGGINIYAYVRNNPIRRTDRFGLLEDGPTRTGKMMDPYGHSDLPGYPTFDWTAEDHDPATSPINPFGGICRHFRPIDEVVNDIDRAIATCNKSLFERLMHQGQDYYSHYSKSYRCESLGHAKDSIFGNSPDNDYQAWLKARNFTEKMLKRFSAACPCGKWGDITIRWY